MKALTLYQPWASLVALGVKPHETRSRRTHYRGPLLIHAAKRWTVKSNRERCNCNHWLSRYCPRGPALPAKLPLGAIVALVDLKDCQPTDARKPDELPLAAAHLDHLFGDWSPGRWAWRLGWVRSLPEPIPWPGAQGLWNVPPELEARVLAALAPGNLELASKRPSS